MMKIAVYEMRADEARDFESAAARRSAELSLHREVLTLENADTVSGCTGVTTLGRTQFTRELLTALRARGVRYVSTRTIGYNHIDLDAAKELGIRVCNANYAPTGVADYTVMLMLLSLRKYKPALWRMQVNDYSLAGLQGREMKDLTIGILGTGKIGAAVIRNLSGFGCRILASDVRENPAIAGLCTYVDADTLYRTCDVISLHTPLLESTRRMINRETLAKMKDGVMLINCARGELMDFADIIEGIERCKIGSLALDVFDKEEGIYHENRRDDILANRDMAYLRQFPNVIMTQHMAFYTDAAVRSMVSCGIDGLCDFDETGHTETELA
ncbi:MAG: D-isomer specific 2-hydroxyacid dehydrogenase family protein [Hominenteromicrobium sp.]